MSAKAGEVSRETAFYRCENCHHRLTLKAGALITPCEMCGHTSFQTGWNRSFGAWPRAEGDPEFPQARNYSAGQPMPPTINGKPGVE